MSTFNHGPESRVRDAKNLPRNQLRIATLNVRTLTQAGSLEALKMDLAKYKLDILGVQETRLQEQEIDLGDHKLYLSDSWLSGVKSRQGGVGVAVKKSLINSIVEQVALSERICYVKFAARRRANLAVVVCYDSNVESKPKVRKDAYLMSERALGRVMCGPQSYSALSSTTFWLTRCMED